MSHEHHHHLPAAAATDSNHNISPATSQDFQ
jgi:hypothetical protein